MYPSISKQRPGVAAKAGHKFLHAGSSAVLAASIVLLSFVVVQPMHAQTLAVLHNFTGGRDGAGPLGTIAMDRGGNLYGAAGETIYKLAHRGSGWTLNPLYVFTGVPDGEFPNGVSFGPDGTVYVATWAGGIPHCLDGIGCGTAARLRPSANTCANPLCPWTETILHSFDPDLSMNGWEPLGTLLVDAGGNVYGTTYYGGQFGAGAVYELSPSNGSWVESVLYSFSGGGDGGNPAAGLTFDQSGNLYGTTSVGGDSTCYLNGIGCGTVFKLTRSGSNWTESTIHALHNGEGISPSAEVIFDAAGNLYGSTPYGGSGNGGTVFEVPHTGNFVVIAALPGNGSGSTGPLGALALDAAGALYGTTATDGAFGLGSVFKLTPANGSWTYSSLHDFTGGLDGEAPEGNVVVGSNGVIYGTTLAGGTGTNCGNNCGVVFQIAP